MKPTSLIVLLLLACSSAAWADAYTEVETDAGVTSLSNGSPDWHSQELDWRQRDADASSYGFALGHVDRFDLSDRYVTADGYLPLSSAWAIQGEASVSPEHNVLPQDALFAGLVYVLPSAWNLNAGFHYSHYSGSDADVASLGVEHYFGDWRAAYTLYEGSSGGASGASNVLRLDWYYGDRSHVGLGLVRGNEVDRVSPVKLVVTPVSGAFLTGAQELGVHWAFTYTLGVTSLEDFYTQRGLLVGLAYRF